MHEISRLSLVRFFGSFLMSHICLAFFAVILGGLGATGSLLISVDVFVMMWIMWTHLHMTAYIHVPITLIYCN